MGLLPFEIPREAPERMQLPFTTGSEVFTSRRGSYRHSSDVSAQVGDAEPLYLHEYFFQGNPLTPREITSLNVNHMWRNISWGTDCVGLIHYQRSDDREAVQGVIVYGMPEDPTALDGVERLRHLSQEQLDELPSVALTLTSNHLDALIISYSTQIRNGIHRIFGEGVSSPIQTADPKPFLLRSLPGFDRAA
ncbi:MAG: hypothetical protein OXR66_06455 [Candidatus Woesearchaeota archaeon]|nr:hypothetical protein [Candidatus Woesearchaeota archaeon]